MAKDAKGHGSESRGSGGGTSCIYGLKVSQMSSTHRDILGSMIARIHRAQPQDALN